ncbi:MAG: DUF6034 family protein [Bacteroides sp.]|nr:DUF6034 family protein [Bacteroides sp.]MCM1549988.1 DUF6034 family protein [Clostridium sp.]
MNSIKRKALACTGIFLLLTTGCQQSPDMEYVSNKEEQGTLILDNSIEDSGIPIAEQVHAPTRVNHVCEKVDPYTSIRIDVIVVIPDQTSIPMYTVSAMDIDRETVERYTDILYEGGEFYNREYGSKNRTTDELYEIVDAYRQMLDSAEVTDVEEPVWDAYGNLVALNEADYAFFEAAAEDYQEQIPESEDRLTYGSPISYDFVKHRINANYGFLADGTVVSYDYEFQTASYTGLHNGVEHDLTLYRDGMNSELRFLLARDIRLENGYTMDELYVGEGDSAYVQKPNTCRYSQEEAVALCKDFLDELGIEKMEVQSVEPVSLVKNHLTNQEEFLGNEGYQIWFSWGEGDMLECRSSGTDWEMMRMHDSPYTSEVYRKVAFPSTISSMDGDDLEEDISVQRFSCAAGFCVMNDGIVDAWIRNPIENPELLAENVRLLSFEQVLERGIAQLEVLYGDSGGELGKVDIKISTICLHYARMQSPDTEGEFTMIPVWDFKTDGLDSKSMLTINAIDGSVFDWEQGY